MSPEVFSDFGRQQQFHKSMLERLYDMYPDTCSCKVMLCENYRSNRAIIEFTSELFYDHKLTASKDPVAHSVYYPLTFFTARGEEVQHENSSGYFNTAEVSLGLSWGKNISFNQNWQEFMIFIPPANFVCGGNTVFTLSVRPCICPSVRNTLFL